MDRIGRCYFRTDGYPDVEEWHSGSILFHAIAEGASIEMIQVLLRNPLTKRIPIEGTYGFGQIVERAISKRSWEILVTLLTHENSPLLPTWGRYSFQIILSKIIFLEAPPEIVQALLDLFPNPIPIGELCHLSQILEAAVSRKNMGSVTILLTHPNIPPLPTEGPSSFGAVLYNTVLTMEGDEGEMVKALLDHMPRGGLPLEGPHGFCNTLQLGIFKKKFKVVITLLTHPNAPRLPFHGPNSLRSIFSQS